MVERPGEIGVVVVQVHPSPQGNFFRLCARPVMGTVFFTQKKCFRWRVEPAG